MLDIKYRIAGMMLAMLTTIVPFASVSGATSFSVGVGITKIQTVKISNINDWDFAAHASGESTSDALRSLNETCVFSSTGAYSLQVSSQNGGASLRLRNSAGYEMGYKINLRLLVGNSLQNRTVRDSNSTLSGLSASSATDCNDQGSRDWNLRFHPSIGRNVFNSAPPGTYTDQVTIVVSPE